MSPVYGEELEQNARHEVNLSSGDLVVVHEGIGEPQSIGSYSLRVYSASSPTYPYDSFIAGIILRREGVVERVILYDLDKDGSDEIVVIVRNVGTGSYLSVKAIKYEANSLRVLNSLGGLNKDADPIKSLESAFHNTSKATP
jgi:rRNA maturation protein Rpf1